MATIILGGESAITYVSDFALSPNRGVGRKDNLLSRNQRCPCIAPLQRWQSPLSPLVLLLDGRVRYVIGRLEICHVGIGASCERFQEAVKIDIFGWWQYT